MQQYLHPPRRVLDSIEVIPSVLAQALGAFHFEPVAKRLDLSERAVQRAVRIAENLDREAIKDIRGTMVERNQQELLALVELEQEQQRSAAKEIRDGRAKTVQQARVAIGLDKPVANDPQARLLAQVAAALTKCERATLLQINELLKPLLRSRK